MTSHSPHPAPEARSIYKSPSPQRNPKWPPLHGAVLPVFSFPDRDESSKKARKKSSDRRFSEKREVGPPGTGNHRCGSLLGECATRKVFFQKESGKPNEGLGDEADTHEERTITASGRRRRSTPPRFPPSQRRLISAGKKSIPLSPKAHRPSRELEGSDRISIEKMLLGALQPTSAESSRRLEVPHLSHSDLGC